MKKDGEGFDFIFLEGLVLEGKSMLVFKFFLFWCVFEAMLEVKVNLGFHKLFCIKYMFVLGV
jgi:hypothetical protein